jgi:hypothetical protein
MDMGGHDANVKSLAERFPHAYTVRYYDNHLDTIKRCVARARTPSIWIIASCCDYTDFDFDYRALPWESYQIHCWASGKEKFGDTFLINVDEFRRQQNIELLEWYKDINWHEDGVQRLPWPLLECTSEHMTEYISNSQFDAPYIWINDRISFDAPLWRNRIFYTFTVSGRVALAPREIQGYLDTQIYDYPHISKQKDMFLSEKLQDVIFISNGEPMAEDNWQNLLRICPRAKHSQGVTGREIAYKAAARLSETPWFFAVFAKTEVLPTFDFTFQPDYLQEPKHYIFHSRNPLNGLEYGAMNINLYNKQLVLDTVPGIDFTLSAAHAVVPICASISRFNTDPWITWRSAFREVLKLRQEVEQGAGVEIQYRLDVWRTQAEGENAEHCLRGAQDADAYYTSVDGNDDKLKLSFDWAWLQDYYYSLYNTKPWLESVDV